MSKPGYKYLFLTLFFLQAWVARGQLSANFIASDTAGCPAFIVHFTNLTTGSSPGTTYSWNFDNGGTSSLHDAATTYTAVGTYTVTLTATDGASVSTKAVIIRMYPKPTVIFSANDTEVCPNTPITFTSTSIPGSWGTLFPTWNLGDGSQSTADTVTYSYATPGYYNVKLLDSSMAGCESSLTKGTYIHIFTPPSATYSSTITHFCAPPATVVFVNGSTSTGSTSYQWSFGDGSTSIGKNPSYTYSTTGNFGVKLIVTDGDGCVDSMLKVPFVVVNKAKAVFTVTPGVCIATPDLFTNTGIGYVSDEWFFGDGSTSTADSVSYSYLSPGVFNAQLVVFDGLCYDTATQPVTVSAPIGNLSIFQPCTPFSEQTFTSAPSPNTKTIVWDFNDRHTGSGDPITHTYIPAAPPVYTVTATLTDTLGCINSYTILDTVHNLSSNILPGDTSGCIPLNIHFAIQAISYISLPAINPFGPTPIPYYRSVTSYLWDFGDGSATTTAANPAHVYTTPGIYTARCTITTANGCTTDTTMIVKAGTMQVPLFTMSPTHACTGVVQTYSAVATSSLIDKYNYSFDDGNEGTGQVTTDVCQVVGIHRPTLTVYYNGCPSFPPYELIDTLDGPNSDQRFQYNCFPVGSMTFSDSSKEETSRLWMFSDGTTATSISVHHTFPTNHVYDVTLITASTITGCKDTTTYTTDVLRLPPIMRIGQIDTPFTGAICLGMMDSFYSSVYKDLPPFPPSPLDTTFNIFGSDTVSTVRSYYWYDNGLLVDTLGPDLVDTFRVPGKHTIMLVIQDNHGCMDTVTRKNYIEVPNPIARFSLSFANGCAPVVATYTDMSIDTPGISIGDYHWVLGDGAPVLPTPSGTHIYTTTGSYKVIEVITDTFGCMDSAVSTASPTVYAPKAGFSVSDQTNCVGDNVGFVNLSTTATSWLWTFGDGATSTATSPIHIYTAAGAYDVRQVAYDAFGCTDTLTMLSYIFVNPIPSASFYMDDSFSICPPLKVNFFNNSTGATAFQWNLGDGSFASAANPHDIYGTAGLYTIKLVASNAFGCINTAIGHASTGGYTGSFKYTPEAVCKGQSVHFKATTTGAASVLWDFGDGTISSVPTDTITYTYTVPGRYLPFLYLTGSTPGCFSASAGADSISVDTLVPNFTFSPTPGCSSVPVTFTDSSYSLYSSSSAWLWTFGSGATSTLSKPAYSFSVSGTFPVTLTVTDSAGCGSAITKNVLINSSPNPITGIAEVCTGLTTALSDATGGGTWTSSKTAVATVATGVVSGISAGTAIISYALSTGCNATATATVFAQPFPITGKDSLCVGATTKLSNLTSGGTWSSSVTSVATIGTSGTVTGVSGGTTTISYVTGTGCAATRTETVNALPKAITGTNHVCKGLTTALSDTDPAGAWSSSNTIIATVGATTGIVTGSIPSSVTITYTLSTGCTTTTPVTVNTLPVGITGTSAACQGLTATLSDATAGGTWSSSNTSVATMGTGGTYTGISQGTSTITYTLASGCSATKIVTVNPLPAAIAGVFSVCANATTPLSDGTSGGVWSSSNSSVATIGSVSGISTGVSAGSATISYTITGTGCLVTQAMLVYPLPGAIKGTQSVCAGVAGTLTDATGPGTWTSGNTAVATIGAVSGVYTGVAVGTAAITFTLGTGCATTDTVSVLLMPIAIKGNTAICAGATTALSDSVTGGIWSTAGTAVIAIGSSSGIVTGIAAGTATVTYTTGSACAITQAVTVNPLPKSITGNFSTCSGTTTALSDKDAGGAWSTTNTAVISIGTGTGLVTGITGGTATVTYTLTTGCQTDTLVAIDSLPPAITGTAIICAGDTTLLSDAVTGGAWSSNNTAVATINAGSGHVSGIVAGTAAITYTLKTGCFTISAVTINPLPLLINGNLHVCNGLTTSLSDADPGGTWSSGNTTTALIGTANGLVTAVSVGTAAITYTLLTGCMTNTTVTVDSLPAAITGDTTVCPGLTITLSDAAVSGTWTSSNTLVAAIDISTGMLTGNTAGTTTITYTIPTGCITQRSVTVNPLPVAISGITDLCLDYIASLSDASSGGTWSSASTSVMVGSASGIVTGVFPGTATIVYTLPTSCLITASLTVNPLPTTIYGNLQVCLGLTSAVTDTTTGGAWSSANIAVATIGTAAVYTGVAVGTATISYVLPTGCLDTIAVTVNRLPAAISGDTVICANQSLTLTDSVTGGEWLSSNTSVATITSSSGIMTGISGGTAVITYTSPVGCLAQITATVDPLMTPISGTSPICRRTTTLFSEATTGGTWTSDDTSVATVDPTGLVGGINIGITTISYTALNVCGTATHTISVSPLPYAGNIHGATTMCTGTSVGLNDSVAGGTWSGNSAVAVIDNTGSVSGIAAGTGTLTYTYINSCGTDRAEITVTVNQTPGSPHITTHPDTVQCSETLYQNFGADSVEPAGFRYIWNARNATVYAVGSTRQYCLVNFNSPGTSVVWLTTDQSATACQSADSLVFHIGTDESPDPVVVYYSPEFVCKDNTANSYQWGYDDLFTLDSTLLPGMVNQNYGNGSPELTRKNYWVLTYHGNCLQKSYYNTPTGVKNVTQENIEILLYPNPADAQINIEIKGISKADKIDAIVYDILGKERKTVTITNGAGSFNIAGFTPGVYMIAFSRSGERIGAKTFVKE